MDETAVITSGPPSKVTLALSTMVDFQQQARAKDSCQTNSERTLTSVTSLNVISPFGRFGQGVIPVLSALRAFICGMVCPGTILQHLDATRGSL